MGCDRSVASGTKEAEMSAFDAEYEPSPWDAIADEVANYERTGGAEPSPW